MKYLRHIVTKAVVAKGKKRTESCETLRPPNTPSSILGCWVINHTYQSKKQENLILMCGMPTTITPKHRYLLRQ